MRILHVVAAAGWRGGEIFASDLIASLATDGSEHRVALLHSSDRPGVRFTAPTTVMGADGFQLPGLRVAPRAVRALRHLGHTAGPDIVQAHGGEALKYIVFAGLDRRIPVVLRSVGMAPSWIRHGPRKTAWGYLIRRSKRVVAVAEAIREETVRTFGVPESRVVTIPNAVDSRRLQPQRGGEETRRLLGIPERHQVLLSLGALTWEKDPLAHVEVSARIVGQGRPLTHLIAGDGPMRQQVEEAISRAGLTGRVRMLGARRDVADLLSAADVVLFASRPDGMEGMPATVIEAGMLGRPVVAYAVAGVEEVVESGKTGLLVPHGDADGLVDSTLRLLDDDERRREMGEAARRRCGSIFEIRTVADQYLKLYESLVGT
jgi:glycosyltransferase involved in cell wall biosynthesis